MRVFQYVFCLIGVHRRDHEHTYQHGLTIRSTCRGCNRNMVLVGRRWMTGGRRSSSAG